MAAPGYKALAEAVRRRREAMGLRQSDLEKRQGPSNGTMRNVEGAVKERYAPRTLRQLEAALCWPVATADMIVAHADPELNEYMVEVADEATAAIIARNTYLTPKVGDQVYLGDEDNRARIFHQLGTGSPPPRETVLGVARSHEGPRPVEEGTKVVGWAEDGSMFEAPMAPALPWRAVAKVDEDGQTILAALMVLQRMSGQAADNARRALADVLEELADEARS